MMAGMLSPWKKTRLFMTLISIFVAGGISSSGTLSMSGMTCAEAISDPNDRKRMNIIYLKYCICPQN